MDHYEKRIEALYLVRCSPQKAYDWLRDHGHKGDDKPSIYGATAVVLEYLLVRRGHPLIDLGIARFGSASVCIKRVYDRGDTGIRCAALSNPHVGPSRGLSDGWLDEHGIESLIEGGSSVELEALAKNPFLADYAIEKLLEKSEEFSNLSESQYLHMLLHLGENPRIAKPYDNKILDGFAEHLHGSVFNKAWELTRTLPAEHPYPYVLYELLNNAELPVGFDDVDDVIGRWRIEDDPKDEEGPTSTSFLLRSRLADLKEPGDDLLKSEDSALRDSFYRRFRLWEYSDWPKFMEKDHALFDALIQNPDLWRTEESREQLSCPSSYKMEHTTA